MTTTSERAALEIINQTITTLMSLPPKSLKYTSEAEQIKAYNISILFTRFIRDNSVKKVPEVYKEYNKVHTTFIKQIKQFTPELTHLDSQQFEKLCNEALLTRELIDDTNQPQ